MTLSVDIISDDAGFGEDTMVKGELGDECGHAGTHMVTCLDCGGALEPMAEWIYRHQRACEKVTAQAKRIAQLEAAITEFILDMDKTMKGPSTFDRGQRIAQLVGRLQAVLEERKR